MKITSIASICKKCKYVALLEQCDDQGGEIRQYISDGSAFYPIDGLPYLTSDNILTIFDIPEKQRAKWIVQTQVKIPEAFNVEDVDLKEHRLDREKVQIVYGARVLRPLHTSRRDLVFIDNKYLSPLTDVLDVLELFERYAPNGEVYIVAKAGLLLQAIIIPEDIVDEQFIINMKNLTMQCEQAFQYKNRAINHVSSESEQFSIEANPKTGEVIDFGEDEENDNV